MCRKGSASCDASLVEVLGQCFAAVVLSDDAVEVRGSIHKVGEGAAVDVERGHAFERPAITGEISPAWNFKRSYRP